MWQYDISYFISHTQDSVKMRPVYWAGSRGLLTAAGFLPSVMFWQLKLPGKGVTPKD